jgi:hypothetical protein
LQPKGELKMDYSKMLFVLALNREAISKRSQYINQLPEHKREEEKAKYTYSVALREAYNEILKAAEEFDAFQNPR